jgi:Uma2 family endonuclease
MTTTRPPVSPELYLAAERVAEAKSEYVFGKIRAMAGSSEDHNVIVMSIAFCLFSRARSRGCRVYSSDQRLWIAHLKRYYYPDVSIVCGKARMYEGKEGGLTNPVLLVEVLSPSTEKIDREEKLAAYREIPSLLDYLIVWQNTPRVERHWRRSGGHWQSETVEGLEGTLPIASLECEASLRDLYDQVEFGE